MRNNLKPIKEWIKKSISHGLVVSVLHPHDIMVDMSDNIDEIMPTLELIPSVRHKRLIEVHNIKYLPKKRVATLEVDLVEYDEVSGRGYVMSVDDQEPAFKV